MEDTAAVSIRDVARRAGLSVGTVSNVLNHRDKVAPESVRRVREAIDELGYVRNDAARQLRAGRSLTVGMVVLDVRNPFFTELARGAEREADKHGLAIVLGNSDEDVGREARYLDLFEQQRVRGILISPYRRIDARLARLRERGIPAVIVDRRSADERVSSVSVDDERGGYIATRHLLERGRRRIAFAGGPADIRQIVDRRRGAERAVRGAEGARLDVVRSVASRAEDGRLAAVAMLEASPGERPDAVFAANDLVALGVLQAFASAGVRVPDDIAIVGYDDILYAEAAVVPLSSVRQPSELMGETAVGMLIEQSEDSSSLARQTVFDPELVVRASSG